MIIYADTKESVDGYDPLEEETQKAEWWAKYSGRVLEIVPELVHSESLGRPDLSYDQFDMPERDSDILTAEA